MMSSALALLLMASNHAKATEAQPTPNSGPPILSELPKFAEKTEGFGVGFGLGEPTGLAFAYRPDNRQTLSGIVGWGVRNAVLHVHMDYLVTVASIQPPESILQADAYVGVGPTINVRDASQPGLGIRIPVGVSLSFQKPVDVFMEVAPVIGLIPSTALAANGTMGVRTWFQ